MNFQPKNLNFQMALNSFDVYHNSDHKEIHQKFHSQP